MKKFSTMKKWGVLSWTSTALITLITVVSALAGANNVDALRDICALAWADTGVFTAAYAFKERAENKKKIAVGLIKDLATDYGIDSIAPIVQSIIQD